MKSPKSHVFPRPDWKIAEKQGQVYILGGPGAPKGISGFRRRQGGQTWDSSLGLLLD